MTWRSEWRLLCVAALLGCGAEPEAAIPPAAAAPAEAEASRSPGSRDAMGTVVGTDGDVRLRRTSAASWIQAAARDALFARDSVQTMEAATARIRFEGGASTTLQPLTTLQLPDAPPEVTRLRHVSGRMRAQLTPGGSTERLEVELPPGTLIVHSDQAESGVLEARVEVDDQRTQIAMLHGRADLRRDGGTPLPVEQRRFVTVSDDGALIESGWLGEPIVLVAPVDGSTVRTRGPVRFRWRPMEGVDAYQLEIAAGTDGEPTAARTVTETSAELELSSGPYRWSVRGLRAGETQQERAARALVVELDRTAPPLDVVSPRPGERVSGSLIIIRGSTEPGARLTIDGRPVPVGDDGSFRLRRTVRPGLLNLVVRVSDDLGNTRSVARTVVRE